MKIHQIINSFYNSNTYILYKEEEPVVWLIDCGDVSPIIDWMLIHHKYPKGVLLTHTHFDHIYGLNKLKERYPNLIVYTSKEGKLGLGNPRWNMSLFHETNFTYEGNISILQSKEQIQLFKGILLTVYETPGHDWSCLSYSVLGNLFTGDSYIPNTKLVANFPKSNREQAKHYHKFLIEMQENHKHLFPGHNSPKELTQ